MIDTLTAHLPDCSAEFVAAHIHPRRQPTSIRTLHSEGQWLAVSTNGTHEDREAARAEVLAAMVEAGSAVRVLRFGDE